MLYWLFQLNWKSIKRSPDFERKVIVNIIFGILVLFMVLQLLMLGFFLDRMIKEDILPGSDPVVVVNGVLMFYFGIDFVIRLVFQKLRSTAGKPYLVMNMGKNTIADFVLLKTPWTLVNLFPLLIVVPFFFNGVLATRGIVQALAWLTTLFSTLLFNTYLVNYTKLRFYKNSLPTSLAVGAVLVFIFLEKLKLISLTSFSAMIFQMIMLYPGCAIVPILAAVCMYRINHSFLVRNLYIENLAAERKNQTAKEYFSFLRRFGMIGALISLDIKLMLRNKRSRVSMWMPFLFLFYGLFFYPGKGFSRGDGVSDFMQLFVGLFISGFFIMSYGMMTFCYESNHFSFLLTRRIDMFTYLRTRYYFMIAMATIVYVLSVFYLYFGVKVFIVNTMMYIFNVGFTAFFFLFLSTFNKIKFDLSAGMSSLQGKGSNQFAAIFALILLMLIFYLPLRIFLGNDVAIYFFGVVGVIGFISQNMILNFLLHQFYRRRYIMSEGFRQT